MASMPCHADVLYLIAQYLQMKGLFASSLALQQESGLDVTWLRGSSHELALLRRWIFDGDVRRARGLLRPLQNYNIVPEEMQAALLALDNLEMLVMKMSNVQERSRLARAKVKCFEKLVPLFRAAVDEQESEVFKYVAMPKLQLVGLIHDALVYHRQSGDDTVEDCISLVCDVDEGVADGEGGELLLLEMPRDEGLMEENAVSGEVENVACSTDWMRWRSRRRNPMALSVSLRKRQWEEDAYGKGEVDEKDLIEKVEESGEEREEQGSTPIVKETADVAVNCGTGEWSDVGTQCSNFIPKETTDVAVSCGPEELSDVGIQTESFELPCLDGNANERAAECEVVNNEEVSKGNELEEPVNSGEDVIDEPAKPVDKQSVKQECEEQMDQAIVVIESSASSSKSFRASSTGKSSESVTTTTVDIVDAHPEIAKPVEEAFPPEEENLPVEKIFLPEAENSQQELTNEAEPDQPVEVEILPKEENLQQEPADEAEIDQGMGTPQHYDELTLDHVVCASVIAEVKEPQAVRALDVHPSGTHLAVGTNARALRVFDLSTSLQQRQQQLAWLSPLNLLLPLLPVALERHKHHASGIYCVTYNRHLVRGIGATTMIASGAADGSVKVLTTRDKDPFQRQQTDELWIQRGDINGSMGKTRALEFASPHLLWGALTSDRRLCCWDVRRAQRSLSLGPCQTFDGHAGEIQAIAMPQPSTSGLGNTLLLSAALDKTVRLWDTRSRRCERLVTSGTHAAFSLHFHPTDEKLVVSGHQDGCVALWDLRSTTREALEIIVPHQDECRSVRWSPDGRWLLSAAFDGTLCVTQAIGSSLQPVASYHKHYGKVLQAQWHPTEPAFVSSGADKRVKLWAFA